MCLYLKLTFFPRKWQLPGEFYFSSKVFQLSYKNLIVHLLNPEHNLLFQSKCFRMTTAGLLKCISISLTLTSCALKFTGVCVCVCVCVLLIWLPVNTTTNPNLKSVVFYAKPEICHSDVDMRQIFYRKVALSSLKKNQNADSAVECGLKELVHVEDTSLVLNHFSLSTALFCRRPQVQHVNSNFSKP